MPRGDVVKSQEVNTWFIIAGATLILSTFSGSIGGGILTPLRNLIANAGQLHADGAALLALGNTLGYAVLGAIGVPLLMLAIAAIAGNMIQHRLVWSSKSLTPTRELKLRCTPINFQPVFVSKPCPQDVELQWANDANQCRGTVGRPEYLCDALLRQFLQRLLQLFGPHGIGQTNPA